MITGNGRFICDLCGKFVSWSEHYTWTPYGGCQDLEPPDSQHAHVKCFDNLEEKTKQLLVTTSWRKPFHHKIDI
jgi:hypothetical protein